MGRKEMLRDKRGRPAYVADKKKRRDAFNTAKTGLFKKAMELSLRCGSDVAVLIKHDGKLYKYADGEVLTQLGEPSYEEKDNSDYSDVSSRKRKAAVSTADHSEKRHNTEDNAEDCSEKEKKVEGCSVQ
jgi:hypothetical protein